MGNKMLIDAAHPEETRVVVLRSNRVDEFDHESANKKQLRGNIYLAKVTRVEPSLQAAFIDYGGNRHGFLAFSEIHPDYYQIPVADRQALLAEEAEEELRARAAEALEDDAAESLPDDQSLALDLEEGGSSDKTLSEETTPQQEESEFSSDNERLDLTSPALESSGLEADPQITKKRDKDTIDAATASDPQHAPEAVAAPTEDSAASLSEDISDDSSLSSEGVESVGQEDALEELPKRTPRHKRIYKIQEVIKRRQIILVQVVKEERGNKGAALTTYLSLAGRYTVLMPNTARGGGISRKITNPADRKRLRKIAAELEITEGTGLIIRTAGAARTKAEIKRDFEYLLRLWENVRDLTLKSTAPALVYEEGNLIKRSIRDLYSKEIDEILVSGDEAYREAKDFMRMLMPSHAKNVQPYKDPDPLFIRFQIERQLNAMFSPIVTLRSGGYIVINQTEALVAVDVNSGKATREHSIEGTALKTNIEAAEEVTRQLRLRDLAGLIVIDFIDMEERRNNRTVERVLKECLRTDRARIQVGHISHFGLLEMSRQRLRTGVLESSTDQCAFCQGSGVIRSTESVSLLVLRSIEDALQTGKATDLTATAPVDVALYILNQKRSYLKDIEIRFGVSISILGDQNLHGGHFTIERSLHLPLAEMEGSAAVIQMDPNLNEMGEIDQEAGAVSNEADNKKPRRRRRRKRSRDQNEPSISAQGQIPPPDAPHPNEMRDGSGVAVKAVTLSQPQPQPPFDINHSVKEDDDMKEDAPRRPRRRGRRGGRRNKPSGVQRTTDTENMANETTDERARAPQDTPLAAQPILPAADKVDPHHSHEALSSADAGEGSDRDHPQEDDTQVGAKNGGMRRSFRYPRIPRRRPSVTASSPSVTVAGATVEPPEAALSEPGLPQHDMPISVDDTMRDQEISSTDEHSSSPRRGWWQRRVEQSG